MKKILFLIIAFMASTCLWAGEYGSDFKVGKLDYNITSATTVEVTYQEYWTEEGNMYNYYKLTTAIIPSTVTYNGKTYTVTSIGVGAFSECNWLKSVTIPNSVTSIGDEAFYGCGSLTSIIIPESVTHIGENAFGDCFDLSEIYVCSKKEFEALSEFDVTYCDKIVDGCVIYNDEVVGLTYSPTNITSITIPDGVTGIAAEVFSETNIYQNKSNWKNGALYIDNCLIRVDQGVSGNYAIKPGTRLIAGGAFQYCSSLKSVTIPESVTAIGYGAFDQCEALTSISIPEGVTSIGVEAFQGCSSLTDITIPESVTSIGMYALIGIDNWENGALYINNCLIAVKPELSGNYSIKPGTRLIADGAFEGCSGLTSITIPNSVTHIGEMAFSRCSKLNSIFIPESVTSIGEDAFEDCDVLKKIFACSKNKYQALDKYSVTYYDKIVDGLVISNNEIVTLIDPHTITTVNIPEGVTSIGGYAFNGCSSLTDITIPASVTSIGEDAFRNCSSLKSVTIPASVKSIGDFAFSGCKALTAVTIPEGVKSIGTYAFARCSSLTSITIPESVTSIGEGGTFINCTALKSVQWNATNCTIYQYSYGNYYPPFENLSSITNFTFGSNVQSIPAALCCGLSGLTSITIPEGVTSIGNQAFSGCEALKSVTINSDKVANSVNLKAVFGSQVTEYIIGNSVKSIGEKAFYGCKALKSITIPQGVTSIGLGAFYGCSSLKSVTIPESLTSIGEKVFAGCEALKFVTINSNDIANRSNLMFIFGEQVTEYIFGNSVTSISAGAFKKCPMLTAVTIQEGVKSIGDYAFNQCYALTDITIPASVTSIGNWTFYCCLSLKSVTINSDKVANRANLKDVFGSQVTEYILGDSVTSIGEKAFYGCNALTSVTIPEGVTSIGFGAFSDCSSLKSVTIPASVKTIGEGGTFQGCTALESVQWNATNCTIDQNSEGKYYPPFHNLSSITKFTFGSNVQSIPADLCCGLSGLTSITIPAGVTSIGLGAFYDCLELQTINYLGTKKQWKGIEDTNLTIEPKKQIVVHCTDGDVKLKGK